MRFALVEMVERRLGSSRRTHCWAQNSWEAARGAGSAAGSQVGWVWLGFCWVLGVLGVPWACSCAAEKASNLQDALPHHLVYPRLSRPQSESGLPAIHVERKQGHSHFCLEAAYQ